MRRRVVITGMGAVTPIGNNVTQMWDSVVNGRCGIDRITAYDTTSMKVKLAGEIKNLNIDDYIDKRESRKMERFTQLAVIAADEAMRMSGLCMDTEDAERAGVLVSTGVGGLSRIAKEQNKGMEKGFDKISPLAIPMLIANMASGTIAIRYGLKGYASCVVTACASSTNAIGDAFRQIRDGYTDIMVAGGTESAIDPIGIGGFTVMRALSESDDPKRASIPFDKERNGFVFSEGAGILVLEERDHAVKRGANILGEIAGYGANCDAFHMTAPEPEGTGAAACMRMAISDSGIDPDQIGYINAHGTSTVMNDKCETLAIKKVFGEKAIGIPVSSTKSMTGHMLGASGAVEAIITLLALKNDFVPATINYSVPDEDCDLDIVPNIGRKAEIRAALSNSLGFGGHNAALLFTK